MPWHTTEREQLAEALSAVAPDAATPCDGWQARHLAAQVVLRERWSVVGLALVVPPPSGRSESAIGRLAEVGELALFLFGRGAAADVDLRGPADDCAELERVLPV